MTGETARRQLEVRGNRVGKACEVEHVDVVAERVTEDAYSGKCGSSARKRRVGRAVERSEFEREVMRVQVRELAPFPPGECVGERDDIASVVVDDRDGRMGRSEPPSR